MDEVNHPKHYTFGRLEVLDVIEDWKLGYHEGNIVKYVARAKHKGSELTDLRKARFYLDRLIDELDEDGTLEIEPGELDATRINALRGRTVAALRVQLVQREARGEKRWRVDGIDFTDGTKLRFRPAVSAEDGLDVFAEIWRGAER